MSTIQKLRSLELYLAAHPDCEEHSECADRLSDVQELLKEIPDLNSDNVELLKMLENCHRLFQKMSIYPITHKIESLIQKHKQ